MMKPLPLPAAGQVIEINAPDYKDATPDERKLWDQLVLHEGPDAVPHADEIIRARRVRFGIK
jgi:hypothetical protein